MSGALLAGFWGLVGGSSLLVGALLGLYAGASRRVVAAVMAAGSGVLISAVAFDLMDEAFREGGFDAAAAGLVLGAATYFLADLAVSRAGGHHRKHSGDRQGADGQAGVAILVGALLDGIPESAAIGVTLINGRGVSWVFVAAVFLSNVPEALSASAGMRRAGRTTRYILGVWCAVVAVSALSAFLGYVLLRGADPNLTAGIQSFAAGAVLTMLASTMLPEAHEDGGPVAGVLTALGFLVAFVLNKLA
jgi:ZIP family zinc transporter